jgi:hypothetical protein
LALVKSACYSPVLRHELPPSFTLFAGQEGAGFPRDRLGVVVHNPSQRKPT